MLKKALTTLTILTATVTLGVTTTVTPASAAKWQRSEYKLSNITGGDIQKFTYYCRAPLRCWDRTPKGLCQWKHPRIGAYAKKDKGKWACFDDYWSWR